MAKAAALIALGLYAAPLAAAVPKATAAVGNEAAVAAAAKLADGGDCKGVLALLDPLVARTPPGSGGARFSAQLLRMPCLAALDRGKEIPPVLAELKTRAPNHPLVLGYQVFADADAGQFASAADHLAALADTGSPALALMPGSLWRALSQKLTIAHDTDRRDRTALALARAEWSPADQPELAETLAVQGIGALLAAGDPDSAGAMLAHVRRPGALWDMAIQRRYADLWPQIEARLGPESGTAADRYARTALDSFAGNPEDDDARLGAVRAFAALGRASDVIATAGGTAVAPGLGEAQVGIVLGDAQARAASGDAAGGLARLAPFAKLDLAATPEASSALIALAEAYHDTGRYADELALSRTAAGPKSPFSAFGLAWLKRDEACALAGLDRTAEAKPVGDALVAGAGANEAAAVEGLLCLHRDDEAAGIAVRALATADGADRLADQFQPSGALFLHPPSTLRPLWARLLARKDVRAAFDRAARILPKPLWPAAAPRAVPPLPGAAPDSGTLTNT